MYTKFRNVIINQNGTSCITAISLMKLADSAKPMSFIKLSSALGRRLYRKGCFFLSLGNNTTAVGMRTRSERANVVTLTNHVLTKTSSSCVKSSAIAVKQTTLTANVFTKVSRACKRTLNEHKRSLVRLESGVVYSIETTGKHLNRKIVHKRFKTAQNARTTLVLGKNYKTTPYWSKTLTSIAFVKTVLALTKRVQNTKHDVFAMLNDCIHWIISTKKAIAQSRNRLCFVMQQHKLLKLAACNTLNAFVSARACKANRARALLQINVLIVAHKFSIKNIVLKTTFKPKRETVYKSVNVCLD
ncbi:hypothetical protein HCTETULN_012 [Candidatus Hodgkinia cicadicola]|nr:hypothetical protein HCTETULN_012 [Candidatus Hodgkinia cicadicola]